MAEFNGKKFYGYSVENDPDLTAPTWNTKNFEFSCIRPETVQRAIDKVQSDVGASLKQRKSHLLSKLREKGGEAPQHMARRDIDIETHVSHVHAEFEHMNMHIHMPPNSKISEGERKCNLSDFSSPREFIDYYPRQISPFIIPKPTETTHADEFQEAVSNQPALSHNQTKNLQRIVIEEYPKPKWVEIEEPNMALMQIFDLKPISYPPPPPPQHSQQYQKSQHPQLPQLPNAPNMYAYAPNMYQGEIPYPCMPPPPPPPHILQAAGYAYDQQATMGQFAYQNIYTDNDPRAYLVEDSDLEDEMLRREYYTQYCQQRPTTEDIPVSDDNEGCPEFVNIAPKEPYIDMSYLKSTAPMRYSELSDDETQQDYQDQSPRVLIKNRTGVQKTEGAKPKPKKKENTPNKVKQKTLAQLVAEEKMMENERNVQISKVPLRKSHKQTSPTSPPHQSRKMPNSNHVRTKQAQQAHSPNTTAKVPLVTASGKSMEQLKTEKIAIFNKMSRTHERIIEALETLREKLLEVHEPESTSDRNRRNRNGFEFSVRFLRNFLYPLKGMIDTMRNTTREQFNSAASNDACNRVAHIYSLFLQAILTYSKQLRHFMIDQVPQKLTTLLEMLFSTTNICLDKRLFDRNDPLVDLLLSHCKNFLNFMEDLHAKRFVAARESYRKTAEVAPESKYNLKMFMNDLNMYEPRLVPKKSSSIRIKPSGYKPGVNAAAASTSAKVSQTPMTQPAARRVVRKRTKPSKNMLKQRLAAGRVVSDTSDVTIPKRLEEDVQTQVQNCAHTRSSELEYNESNEIVANLQNVLMNTPHLYQHKKVEVINRAIVEALRSAGQGQATEVLEPLLQTINAALDLPDNSERIENILKAFQMKISKALNERKIIYEDRNEGYCLLQEASRTKKRGHTSVNCRNDGINEQRNDERQQQSQQQHHHNNCHCGGGTGGGGVGSGDYTDESDYDSPVDDDDDDDDNFEQHYNIADYDCDDEKDNENRNEEYDEDAQFYVSGEDCDYYNSYKRVSKSNTKNKLEPVVEYKYESNDADIDEKCIPSNGNIQSKRTSSKCMIMLNNQQKRSPYEIPVGSRKLQKKKSTQSITTPTIIPQTKKSAAAAAAVKTLRHNLSANSKLINSKTKHTNVPPSPAMIRLKQRTQAPFPTDRSRKVHLLKKCNRRNPMGSPPPVPTVSPSTSVPHTPSINVSEFHLSLDNIPMSHKGVHTENLSNQNSIEFSQHPMMSFRNAETKSGKAALKARSREGLKKLKNNHKEEAEHNDEDDEDTFRGDQIECIEVPINAAKKELKNYNGGKVEDKAMDNENVLDACKHTPLTLYTGSNPYGTSCLAGAQSPTLETTKKSSDLNRKLIKESSNFDFDESELIKERDQYLSLCMRNRLYSNPKFSKPWKMFSRLSENLTEEVLQAVQTDFATGVEAFVDDFLHLETTM